MQCPRCRGPLLPFFLEDGDAPVEGRQCPACRGTSFASLHQAQAAAGQAGAFARRKAPDRAAQRAPLECPSCAPAVVMQKRFDDPVVDVCPSCGAAWLDAGEVRAID